jgi:hypothetical protein
VAYFVVDVEVDAVLLSDDSVTIRLTTRERGQDSYVLKLPHAMELRDALQRVTYAPCGGANS